MTKPTNILNKQYTLVILKNDTILDSIKDFFYQDLFHEIENVVYTSMKEFDSILDKVNTSHIIVIQEGCFFYDHLTVNFLKDIDSSLEEYSLIGHILNRKGSYYNIHEQCFILNINDWRQAGMPKFYDNSASSLTSVKRSDDNFHDDYTPKWISKDAENIEHTEKVIKLKFGGKVISEMLKHNFKIRPFAEHERNSKKFIYYEQQEQIENLLAWDKLNANHKHYFPYTTKPQSIEFTNSGEHYISVANGLESLFRINKVYEGIKKITFYDISITALIFTEIFINKFQDHYVQFVDDFQTLLPSKHHKIKSADHTITLNKIKPVLEHIRNNNIEVEYLVGDITRNNIIKNINKPTLISLTNVFTYQKNLIRKEERESYIQELNNQPNIKEVLF